MGRGPEISTVQSLTNLARNGGMEWWASGAPALWTLAGDDATIAADATNFAVGLTSAILTRAGADCTLSQNAVGNTVSLAPVQGKTYTLSAAVRLRTAGATPKLGLSDGVTTVWSGFATRLNEWEILSVSRTLSSAANALTMLAALVDVDGACNLDAVMLTEGTSIPTFTPNPGDSMDPINATPTDPTTSVSFTATDMVLGRMAAGAGPGQEVPCTAAGRALLADATSTAQRTTLGLGTAATRDVAVSGDASATQVVKGNDTRLLTRSWGSVAIVTGDVTADISLPADVSDVDVPVLLPTWDTTVYFDSWTTPTTLCVRFGSAPAAAETLRWNLVL
jgi:hypothetical protein